MVVTRFAPSPTGYLHIGGARTALFCWLWARHNKGRMILRIEDTDQKRNTPAAIRQVINDLRWLGIDWDEGPEVNGPNGPYFQSERTHIYDAYIQKLIAEQKAYYCFETTEQLQQMRKEAQTQKGALIFRRPQNPPDQKDAEKARRSGLPVTVRFAVPQDRPITVTDVVRGRVTFDPKQIGDFIIQKSDGFPTYNFACVVDDCLMKITDVIRGQEHLMNTPAQQALWQALFPDTPLPKYAHMSVTISDTGGKLSKRERPKALLKAIKANPNINLEELAHVAKISLDEMKTFLAGKTTPDMPSVDAMAEYLGVHLPEINVVDFIRSGYLPETLINFLALLGWSPGGDREIMSVDELIEHFDITRLTKTNSLFDRQKLLAFNTERIRTTDREKLLAHFRNYLRLVQSPCNSADDKMLQKILEINAGARTFADIERKSSFLFLTNDKIEYNEKAVKKILLKGDGLAMLKVVRDELDAMDRFTEENIENMLRRLAQQKGVGLGKVAQPLRVAICGNTISPPIFDSVKILGKKNTLARIDIALNKFGTQSQ